MAIWGKSKALMKLSDRKTILTVQAGGAVTLQQVYQG